MSYQDVYRNGNGLIGRNYINYWALHLFDLNGIGKALVAYMPFMAYGDIYNMSESTLRGYVNEWYNNSPII